LGLPPRVSIEDQRRPTTAWFEAEAVRTEVAAVRATRVNIVNAIVVDEWCMQVLLRVDV